MGITASDINIHKFLELFTFEADPNPGTKIKLPWETFLQIASLLKLDFTIQNSVRMLKFK